MNDDHGNSNIIANQTFDTQVAPGVPVNAEDQKVSLFKRTSLAARLLFFHYLLTFAASYLGFAAACLLLLYTGMSANEFAVLAVMFFLTHVGLEIGYHRLFSHASFKAKMPLRSALAIFGSMTGQGGVIYWTALHRHHHSSSDTADDIHTPYFKGKLTPASFIHAYGSWILSQRITNPVLYVPDLLQDKPIRFISQTYFVWFFLGLLAPGAILYAISGNPNSIWRGIIFGGLARMFLVNHATGCVNSICHIFGKRSFATKDKSVNNGWLAIPTLGASWHNNHHAFPWSARLDFSPMQIDPGGWLIQIFALLGLASEVRKPAAELIKEKQQEKPN